MLGIHLKKLVHEGLKKHEVNTLETIGIIHQSVQIGMCSDSGSVLTKENSRLGRLSSYWGKIRKQKNHDLDLFCCDL